MVTRVRSFKYPRLPIFSAFWVAFVQIVGFVAETALPACDGRYQHPTIYLMPTCFSFPDLRQNRLRFRRPSLVDLAVLLALASVSRAQPEPLTAGLEFNPGPGRLALDPGFSLAERSFTVEAWIRLNVGFGDRPVLAPSWVQRICSTCWCAITGSISVSGKMI